MAILEQTRPSMRYADVGGAVEIAPRSDLQELLERIDRAFKSATDAAAILSSQRDRLFGERPQGGEKSQTRPVRGGLIGGLHDRADDLNGVLETLHSLIEEIGRVG